ncbi:TLC domain-containing protein [Dipodascopsis tothii]|uniref:TLC domain-containing protein n=1 Tax=Dipodascopsis tothii TaxID=44089 RepID=UPI0034CD0F1B
MAAMWSEGAPFWRDPLYVQYPPAVEQKLLPLCDALGLPTLALHFHEVVLAFVLYQTIFVLSPTFFRGYKAYANLKPRTQLNFDIHVVSMVQCLLILALSFPAFWEPALQRDHIFAYSGYGGMVYAFAVGYFAWDSYVSIRYVKYFGVGFVVHGVGSLLVFTLSFKPFLMYYGPVFLLFEASTPFLNVHWFSTHLPAGTVPERLQLINGALLMASFFGIRIVWGFYSVARLALDLWAVRERLAPVAPLAVLGSNLALDCLNVYWFSKMVAIVKGRVGKKPVAVVDAPVAVAAAVAAAPDILDDTKGKAE